MRGQLILLTAVLVAIALTTVLAGQLAIQLGQHASAVRSGYGIYAKPWPEVVDLVDSYALQTALKSASHTSTGGLTAGLYMDRQLVYRAVGSYVNKTLVSAKVNFLPLGAQLDFEYRVWHWGFNGSLAPYPRAVQLSEVWNLNSVRNNRLSIPGAVKLYRLTVFWSAENYDGYYVVTYGAHVSEPGAVGEDYNTALAELLDGLAKVDVKRSLYIFLVNNDAVERGECGKALIQLPWWAEIAKCPLCLLHVRIPARGEIGARILERGKAIELLAVYAPNYIGGVLPVLCNSQSTLVPVSSGINNDPRATFATSVTYHGGVGYGTSLYWSGSDIAGWSRSIVRDNCRTNPVTGGVINHGVGPNGVVWARYSAGTRNWAFNVYRYVEIPQGWRGVAVETSVKPISIGIRTARLDLYHRASNPQSTHPICANFVAIQGVSPAVVWSYWRSGVGVWNGRTWDDAGTIQLSDVWYFFSLSFTASSTRYEVYLYNTTRPVRLLGSKIYNQPPWGTTDWRFYVVLGSAIVDNPFSTTSPWTESAQYRYVRIRPHVDPPPAVVLTPVEQPPAAKPDRVDIIALRNSGAGGEITLKGSVGLSGVEELSIVRNISLNASILEARSVSQGPNQATYSYVIQVNSTVPRATLAAKFTLFYSLGSTYVNKTCPSELCSVELVKYYGFAGGVDRAEYRIDFTTPTWVNSVILVSTSGVKTAVSNTRPEIYALSSTGRSYYIINEGNATAVFVFPWTGTQRPIADVSPADPRYVGVYDVDYGTQRRTILLVPPGSAVNVTFATPQTHNWLRDKLVRWQRDYYNAITQRPCTNFVRVYLPGNASRRYYYVMLHDSPDRANNVRAFIGGQWIPVRVYRDGKRLWLRLEATPLSGRAVLLAVCSDGTSERPETFFDFFKRGSDAIDVRERATLSEYPDGFTVVISTRSGASVALYNGTSFSLDWFQNCREDRKMMGIWRSGYVSLYWWHYDGFCYDRHIWEYQKDDGFNYTLSLSPAMALYQIVTVGDPPWWFRSYPNSAPALGGRPMTAFTRVYSSAAPYSVAVIPFTWPRPYYYLDYARRGPFSTT